MRLYWDIVAIQLPLDVDHFSTLIHLSPSPCMLAIMQLDIDSYHTYTTTACKLSKLL